MPGDTKLHQPYHRPASKKLVKPAQELPIPPSGSTIVAQFKSPDGSITGPSLNLPIDVNPEQLLLLLNNLLQNSDPLPFSFFVQETEIQRNLFLDVIHGQNKSTESTLTILYQPLAVFKVQSISRCTSTLTGHTEAILSVAFSPDGCQLATGSGDTTVRIWDLNTETPQFTLKGHVNWVQIVSWSPDCQILASGSMDSTIRLWNPKDGSAFGDAMRAHSQCITSISWEPMHSNIKCHRFASGSKDGTIRIWDATLRKVIFVFSQHTAPVMCVKWGGEGHIYSASRDKTIKVWDTTTGSLLKTLEGHGHWVNHLALNSDYILRTGPYDHTKKQFETQQQMFDYALERYNEFKRNCTSEKVASGSDDFTLFLWDPLVSKKPIARMTGHQQLVNHLSFSPDGRMIASASFDKSVKLWDGKNGKFISTLRGHVGAIYQVCWSSDSRQILSGSRDSTLKAWDLKTCKMKTELPGHADEVFSVDWSPSGEKVASGGKDCVLKM